MYNSDNAHVMYGTNQLKLNVTHNANVTSATHLIKSCTRNSMYLHVQVSMHVCSPSVYTQDLILQAQMCARYNTHMSLLPLLLFSKCSEHSFMCTLIGKY